jgi:hypothetical protein
MRHTIALLALAGCGGGNSLPDGAPTPTPTVLTESARDPKGIAVDDTHVYFSDQDRFASVSKTGGGAQTRGSIFTGPQAVRVNSTSVIWVDGTDLRALRLADEEPWTIGGPPAGGTVYGFGLDDTQVIYPYSSDLLRHQLSDGARTGFLEDAFALDVTLTAGYAFYTSCDEVGPRRIPLAGGAPIGITSGQSCPITLASTASHVFWLDLADSDTPGTRVMRSDVEGTDVTQLASFDDIEHAALAADDSHVYWATRTAIWRVAHSGGELEVFVEVDNPSSIALDATSVYWTAAGESDQIATLTK